MFSAGDNTVKAGQQNPATLLQVPLPGMQQLLGRSAELPLLTDS